MSAGEVGCALSHVRLWRLFAESSQDDDDLALILEDDAALVPDFAARVSAAWAAMPWLRDAIAVCQYG